MIQTISGYCYTAFLILAAASPFVPVYLIWRFAGLSVVAFAAGYVIKGPVHWSDQNAGYALGILLLIGFCRAVLAGIIIRFVFAATQGSLNKNSIVGPKSRFMMYFDTTALIAIGCSAGLLLTIHLAFSLSGSLMGPHLDFGVAAISFTAALIVFALSRNGLAVIITAVFATMSVLAFTLSGQANRILTNAKSLADGQAWCLTASIWDRPITDVSQLGFFSLPKGDADPHLSLAVRQNDQAKFIAHWSIRYQAFDKAINSTVSTPSCLPIENFEEVLTAGGSAS